MSKPREHSFIPDLVQEECARDPEFRREYEAEKLAEKLRRIRARHRITVESVAEAMNTAQPSITRLESRPESVSLMRFIEYARVLGYQVALKKATKPTAKQNAIRAISSTRRRER